MVRFGRSALERAGVAPDIDLDDAGLSLIDEIPPATSPEDFGLSGDVVAAGGEGVTAGAVFVTPGDWPDTPPPAVEWIAHQRIVRGDVATLHADGGGGKTQAALQLAWQMTCGALDWLGTVIEPGPVVFLSAEEPELEIRRRSIRVRDRSSSATAPQGLHFWFPEDLQGCTLAVPNSTGAMTPTPLFQTLRAAIVALRPALVVLDNVAAVFGGSQNDRVQVRTFVNLWRGLAREANCAVLLLDHPSMNGLNSGSGRAGSVDWRNAVRSALHLRPSEDKAEADRGVRILEIVKSNYGPVGQAVRLEWNDGVLAVEGTGSPAQRAARDQRAEELFLALLDERNRTGRHVSDKPGRNYAPAVFAESEQADGYTNRAFARVMERMFTAGTLVREQVGPPSRNQFRLVTAETEARR